MSVNIHGTDTTSRHEVAVVEAVVADEWYNNARFAVEVLHLLHVFGIKGCSRLRMAVFTDRVSEPAGLFKGTPLQTHFSGCTRMTGPPLVICAFATMAPILLMYLLPVSLRDISRIGMKCTLPERAGILDLLCEGAL
jgi:hypothetical protein